MSDYDSRSKIESIFRETKRRDSHPVYHFVNNGNVHITGDIIIQTPEHPFLKKRVKTEKA